MKHDSPRLPPGMPLGDQEGGCDRDKPGKGPILAHPPGTEPNAFTPQKKTIQRSNHGYVRYVRQ